VSWVPTAKGALRSDIVKLQALEEELLNGLHDAMLRAISLDLVGQTAELWFDYALVTPTARLKLLAKPIDLHEFGGAGLSTSS
jgi:hypothetical protein